MWKTETYYEVAIWWPKDQAYGGAERVSSLPQLRKWIEQARKLGYANGDGKIHARKVTLKTVDVA